MSTKITKLEKQTGRMAGKVDYVNRLVAALGNPSEWEYRGEMFEDETVRSECACGHHGLRFLFPIYHENHDSKIIGSSCIKHFRTLSPEIAEKMTAVYEKHLEALKEAKKKVKAITDMAEIKALCSKYIKVRREIQGKYEKMVSEGGRATSWWRVCESDYSYLPMFPEGIVKEYTMPSAAKKRLKRMISDIETALVYGEKELAAYWKKENETNYEIIQIAGIGGFFDFSVIRETPKAYLLRNDERAEFWVPKKSMTLNPESGVYFIKQKYINDVFDPLQLVRLKQVECGQMA